MSKRVANKKGGHQGARCTRTWRRRSENLRRRRLLTEAHTEALLQQRAVEADRRRRARPARERPGAQTIGGKIKSFVGRMFRRKM